MCVAVEMRVGPDLKLCQVGADAGEAERRRDIHIRRKRGRAFARAALEDACRAIQPFEIDVVFNDVGRALQRIRRLACHHPDRVDGPFRRRAHRVQPEQRAGGKDDPRLVVGGLFLNVRIRKDAGAAHRDQDLAAANGCIRDLGEHRLRGTIDDDVAGFGDILDRHDLDRRGQGREKRLRFLAATGGDAIQL